MNVNQSGLDAGQNPLQERGAIKAIPGPTNTDALSDDTPLIRYMRLSTFLLLLDCQLFIPSLPLLRSGDRLERKILEVFSDNNIWEKMRDLVTPHAAWLRDHARDRSTPEKERNADGRLTSEMICFLARTWLERLDERRIVWCWNQNPELSYLMWKVYGDRGVAVRSTVGDVRKALADAGAWGIVSKVVYVPRAFRKRHENPSLIAAMGCPENLKRPYFFKDSAYRGEEEVRFVLRARPVALKDYGGAMIRIDPKAFITKGIQVSPDLPKAERDSIEGIWSEWCRRQPDTQLQQNQDDPDFLRPLAREDDPRQVFTDLD